jgi:hypothetical protein
MFAPALPPDNDDLVWISPERASILFYLVIREDERYLGMEIRDRSKTPTHFSA